MKNHETGHTHDRHNFGYVWLGISLVLIALTLFLAPAIQSLCVDSRNCDGLNNAPLLLGIFIVVSDLAALRSFIKIPRNSVSADKAFGITFGLLGLVAGLLLITVSLLPPSLG